MSALTNLVRFCAFVLMILGIVQYLIGSPMADWLFPLVASIVFRTWLLVHWARP